MVPHNASPKRKTRKRIGGFPRREFGGMITELKRKVKTVTHRSRSRQARRGGGQPRQIAFSRKMLLEQPVALTC